MENKKLLEKLSQMRKNFVADRVRDKQDLVYAIQFLEYQIGVEGGQSPKNLVGALALPTGKFLHVRKVFARFWP